MRDTDTQDGGSARSEVLGGELAELGRAVTAGLVLRAVEAAAEAGPEGGLVEQLHGLGGAAPAGQLQLQSGQSPLHLPGFEGLVGDAVSQEVGSDLCVVSGALDRVERVLPALGAAQAAAHLLDVPADGEGRVLLGGQTGGDTEGVRHPGIVVSLVTGPSLVKQQHEDWICFAVKSHLDGDPEGGDGTVVLYGGHSQPVGQRGDLQWLRLDELPLGPGHGCLAVLPPGRALHCGRLHDTRSHDGSGDNTGLESPLEAALSSVAARKMAAMRCCLGDSSGCQLTNTAS